MDLTKAQQSVTDIVGNPDVIAINQDAAGNQGVVVLREVDTQVVVKSLAERGAKAVALINRGGSQVSISVPLAHPNLDPRRGADLRNVWTGTRRKLSGQSITAVLQPFETMLLAAKGAPELNDGVYLREMPALINVAVGGSLPAGQKWVPAQANAAPSGAPLNIGGKVYHNGLGVLVNSRLEVRLDKAFRRFRVTIGALDAAAKNVSFRVYGDGKLLGEARTRAPRQLDVGVTGVQMLELVAEAPDAAFAVA